MTTQNRFSKSYHCRACGHSQRIRRNTMASVLKAGDTAGWKTGLNSLGYSCLCRDCSDKLRIQAEAQVAQIETEIAQEIAAAQRPLQRLMTSLRSLLGVAR